jgi:chemotaxis-related protein WspD
MSFDLQLSAPVAPEDQMPELSLGLAGELVDPCWNKIGVYGDHSCKELQQFIHCRNCPIHARAGVKLLDRSPPAGSRREWTEHFAAEKSASTPARSTVLVFRVGAEWLALPARAFQEVAPWRHIHSLPHRRQGLVLGLANIRGELLVCIALNRLLGIEEPAPGTDPQTRDKAHRAKGLALERLLVVNWNVCRVVLPADEVAGLYRFVSDQLKPPPSTLAKASATFTRGLILWPDKSVGLLDPDVLFPALNQSLT